MEIEKKFLVKHLPDDLCGFDKKEIEQGYLCSAPIVRIRKSNEDYILTYKNKEGVSESLSQLAKVLNEVELSLTKESYEHLREKVDGHLVCKTRYLIPLANGRTAELDIFHKQLDGLIMVEVEFPDIQAIYEFTPPDWFGEEVSNDHRYGNGYLAKIESYKYL